MATGPPGWGAAMSTDTAFALGVLALLAPNATRLRVALLTFAVVDDLAALLVIATVYTEELSVMPLVIGLVLFGGLLALRWAPPSWRGQAAVVLGVAVWVALLDSGIDPVITGLAVGLITTAYPPGRSDLERVTELARSFREQPTPALARSARLGVDSAVPANDRLQYRLHPWTSFVIVPLFALANVGVHLDGDLLADAVTSPITLGILLGYVVGKPAGIMGGVWLASRPRFGLQPSVSFSVASLGATVAGIGFTVSLLVASLAFSGQELEEAKLGVLGAAVIATALGALVVQIIKRLPESLRARQVAGTRDEILDLSDDIDPDADHIRGSHSAPVTLVEYGDYECPYCGRAEVAIRELLSSFGDDLRYVWRNLPLNDVHLHAQLAAEAAEAAAEQGAFWEMHDLLLSHQDALEMGDLGGYAETLGLDAERFWRALEEHRNRARDRAGRRERGRERRGGHADVLHQRDAPRGRLRRGDPHRGGPLGSLARADAPDRPDLAVAERGRGGLRTDGAEPAVRGGAALEQLARKLGHRSEPGERERATDGDPRHADLRELGDRRSGRPEQHVDGHRDGFHDRADLARVHEAGRVEHVRAGRLVGEEAGDRVVEVVDAVDVVLGAPGDDQILTGGLDRRRHPRGGLVG